MARRADGPRGEPGEGITADDWLVAHQDRVRAAHAAGLGALLLRRELGAAPARETAAPAAALREQTAPV